MQKFLVFKDEQRHEISPLSYREFMALDLWGCASDMAFAAWLRHNRLVEIEDFTHEALAESDIEVHLTSRQYEVNPTGDGDTWIALPSPITGRRPLSKPEGDFIVEAIKSRINEGFADEHSIPNCEVRLLSFEIETLIVDGCTVILEPRGQQGEPSS